MLGFGLCASSAPVVVAVVDRCREANPPSRPLGSACGSGSGTPSSRSRNTTMVPCNLWTWWRAACPSELQLRFSDGREEGRKEGRKVTANVYQDR